MTDLAIKRLKPKNKEYTLQIENGLYIKITPKGKKVFLHRYSKNKKAYKITLGEYPGLSLTRAREMIQELKTAKPPKAKKPTFSKIYDDFLTHSYENNLRELQRFSAFKRRLHALHELGVDEITPLLIINAFTPLKKEGKHASAAKYLGFLKRLFKDALMREYIERDPCYLLSLKALMGTPPPVRHHATIVTPLKLGRLLADILAYSGSASVKMAALLQAFSAVRPSNARLAMWSEFDLNAGIWQIGASKMKMGEDFRVHLSTPLLRLLKSYKELNLNNEICFPSSYGGRALSENALRVMYRALGYTNEDFTPHGWRASFSTICNENDKNADIIELCLDHAARDKVRAAYNHSKREGAKALLWEWWGEYLCELAPVLKSFEF